MGGARFSHAPNSCRQVISSPLAKLSMSSSLEEGAGGSGMGGGGLVSSTILGSSLSKHHHVSETMATSSKEDSAMESDNEGGPNLEELPVVTAMVADKAPQA